MDTTTVANAAAVISMCWVLIFGGKTLVDIRRGIKISRGALANIGLGIAALLLAGSVLAFTHVLGSGTSQSAPRLTGFAVTSLANGQVIRNQDLPLTIMGTYTTEGPNAVWVVLRDNLGQDYLQYPPVQFQGNGHWSAANIRPGPGITSVNFVEVTAAGNDVFAGYVSGNQFGAFPTLPAGSTILTSISIVSQATGG